MSHLKKILRNHLFYFLKPIIPRRFQIFLRRRLIQKQKETYRDIWPIDKRAAHKPEGWPGWPEGKKIAVVLHHDVDTQTGHDNCYKLMKFELELGFRSTFYFVPERYKVSEKLIEDIKSNGFEVGIHGLKHDGKLFTSRKLFNKRVLKINQYLKEWNVTGFSSPAMHHKLEWMNELNIEYATTTFDTDPFEPQPDGICTIYPFFNMGNENTQKRYVELPYTLAQDFTLFVLMQEKDNSIWKTKLDWIDDNGGMALINTHPDYISFNEDTIGNESYPAKYYLEFLQYIREKYKDKYWHPLSKEIANFFNENVNNL